MQRILATIAALSIIAVLITLPHFHVTLLSEHNDLDGNVSQLVYVSKTLIQKGHFAQWNPYINQGIPTIADPLNSYLNPIVLPLLYIFSPETAVRFMYVASIFLSGIIFLFVLRVLRIKQPIAYAFTLSYMACSYLSARIVAGHLEKVLSYPFIPLFLLSMLMMHSKNTKKWSLIGAISISLMLFSGDIYNTLYAVIITGILGLYSLVIRRRAGAYFMLLIVFLSLASVKILPLIELQNHIAKTREPFEGSQNIVSIIYYVFLPIKNVFVTLGFGEYLKTGFAWWEKTAFIGLVPIFGIMVVFVRRMWKREQVSRLILISIILMSFSAPAFMFNPLRYLIQAIPQLELFHVPSRSFGMLSAVFLLLGAIGLNRLRWRNRFSQITLVVLMFFQIATVASLSVYISYNMRLPQRLYQNEYASAVHSLQRSGDVFYIAQYITGNPLPQHTLVQQEQKILNSNYGLQLKNSPATAFTHYDFGTSEAYSDITPAYFIGTGDLRIPQQIETMDYATEYAFSIKKARTSEPYAEAPHAEIRNVRIEPDTITILAEARQPARLHILESTYPGWSVYVDGEKERLQKSSRFLSATTKTGNHEYTFRFFSWPFIVGAGISALSWLYHLAALKKIRFG